MTRVKICGINAPDALEAAVDAGADWLGLVFFARSPRYVTARQAASLVSGRSGLPPLVGLFVEPTVDEIARVTRLVRLDILQVYGADRAIPAIKAACGLPVWRAVGVQARGDLPTGAGGADGLVVEAKAPPGADRPGGNAVSFDWTILQGWQSPAPWLLAGGLTPGNVAGAVALSGAPAVDVSSGVERSKGVKDAGLIRDFVRAARG